MAFSGSTQKKMSDEIFDIVCNTCEVNGKKTEGVKYCVECGGYCCQTCVDTHKTFPILKTHNLMDIGQVNQASGNQPKLLEFPTERCRIHNGKLLDMFCDIHDAVGCYVCVAKNHKSCSESHIHSIPDVIDTIYKLSDCQQTEHILKEAIVSMETVSQSNDIQIQSLDKSRHDVLGKVDTFQKALEALVKTAADSSRNDVEKVYSELKYKIIAKRNTADTIGKNLKATDDKLKQSEGNRAQRLVCNIIADEQIKEAQAEMTKQDSAENADMTLEFIPNQTLMDNLTSLQGIGRVQTQKNCQQDICRVQKQETRHDGLYKTKCSRDINIVLPDDSKRTPSSYGCCLIKDDKLLVTDHGNQKLKLIDIQKNTVVDSCSVGSNPLGVCRINDNEVAVACKRPNKIIFVAIHNKMSLTRHIDMSHGCYGIAFRNSKLYVTDDFKGKLYVYGTDGTLIDTISKDTAGNPLSTLLYDITFNDKGTRMFIGGCGSGLMSLDGTGKHLSTITDTDLDEAEGVCTDEGNNVFVVGRLSDNVVQFSEDGKKVGIVLKKEDGLNWPHAVCFHKGLKRMFVTMESSSVVKMYELE